MKKYTEADILDFIEGRFTDSSVADILTQKRVDPELADLIDAMQASQLPYKEAYAKQSMPDVPESLRVNLKSLASQYNDDSSESQIVLIPTKAPYKTFATFLLAGLGLGFLAASLLPQFYGSKNSVETVRTESNEVLERRHDQWVQRVADYQSLYVENTVKLVTDEAEERATTLLAVLDSQPLSTLTVPDLTKFGYQFARAQELGFEGEILLQFVYSKPGSLPLAYCVMPGNSNLDLPLQVSLQHQLGVASWKHRDRHSVIVADETPETLKQIHNSILNI